ncbi:response regulator transcription factor [Clostridiaceae bacterium M8S5]|nr:response regulator transcription factor [Clostridiaceae bacterium M8S5]
MHRNVLIIEDEEKIRSIIRDYFSMDGYTVFEAEDGEMGLYKFDNEKIDLIVLDIMLPKIDGWSVCRRIRKKSDVPIIMLTARGDDEDVLLGFELKTDEYIVKPFNPQVLLARANMLLHRTYGTIIEDQSIINIDGISINRLSRELKIEGNTVKATPKEFDLLVYLIENQDKVLTRESILTSIWGYPYYGDVRVVDNYIRKLRKSLRQKAYTIVTVFGVGYKFEVNK